MADDNEESRRILWCGNLNEKVTEELLYELFVQAGPLEKVRVVPGKSFSFITFRHEVSVAYAIELMGGVELYGRKLRLQHRGGRPDSSPEVYQRSNSAPGHYRDDRRDGYRDNRRDDRRDDRRRQANYSSPYSDSSSDNDMRGGGNRHRGNQQYGGNQGNVQHHGDMFRNQALQLQQNMMAAQRLMDAQGGMWLPMQQQQQQQQQLQHQQQLRPRWYR